MCRCKASYTVVLVVCTSFFASPFGFGDCDKSTFRGCFGVFIHLMRSLGDDELASRHTAPTHTYQQIHALADSMGIPNMACASLQRSKKIKEVDIIARTAITYVNVLQYISIHHTPLNTSPDFQTNKSAPCLLPT
jgi:hypothetical protein